MMSFATLCAILGVYFFLPVSALLKCGKNVFGTATTLLLEGSSPRKHGFRLADSTIASTIVEDLNNAGLASLPILLRSHARFNEVESLYKSLICDQDNVNLREPTRSSLLSGNWLTLATDLPYLSYEAPVQNLLALTPDLLKAEASATPLKGTLVSLLQVVGNFENANEGEKVKYDNWVTFKVEGYNSTFASVTFGNCRAYDDTAHSNRLEVEFTGRGVKVMDGEESELERLFASLGDPTTIRDFVNKKDMSLKGWSDVVYLDDDATIRVMKGNAGHFYILKKQTKRE